MSQKDELFEKIDNYTIYDDEYDTILMMLENMDDDFFTKVIEEVVDGNLYISDFKRFFKNNDYINYLDNNIAGQKILRESMSRLKKYRSYLEYSSAGNDVPLGIDPGDLDPEQKKKYTEIYNLIRDELLFDLLEDKPEDDTITQLCKDKLYKMISKGELLLDKKITIQPKDNGQYIYPDDIIFSLDNYILPIDQKHQVLTAQDIDFMHSNNLNEEEMKKIKSVKMFLLASSKELIK